MGRENKTIYVILGFLNHEDLTGYEIKKRIDVSLSYFWGTGFGQIYPTLNLLEKNKWVSKRSDDMGQKLERIIYSITHDGRKQLFNWLSLPAEAEKVKYEILLKLFFGSMLDVQKNIDNINHGETLCLVAEDPVILLEIIRHKEVKLLLAFGERGINYDSPNPSVNRVEINPEARGQLKQLLMKLFYPVEDLAGYSEGTPLSIAWRTEKPEGDPFALRSYQQEAVATFHQEGSVRGGSGVLILPCGAGKTVIGMGVMAEVQCETLILTTNNSAVKQWLRELADKTTLNDTQMGEYTGEKKEICPVTVATYQILTHRSSTTGDFSHFHLFNEKNWGLIIYDEVHLLPAPVFRATADLQAKRRLGLTATLVREDGKEEEVFSLIGPKKVDVPWRLLEAQGWIATAECTEWRIAMSPSRRMDYALAEEKEKFRLAA